MGAADGGGHRGAKGLSVSGPADTARLLAAGSELLHREGALLDEQRWDEWLALFAADCEFWMPAWRTNEELGSDPRTEVSHMYYSSRAGLEDRILRIRSRRSPASMPLSRTAHVVSAILPLEPPTAERMRLRSTWISQVFAPRTQVQHAFFGRSEHELVLRDGAWLIKRKQVRLQNDYIPTMLDIYCV